MNRPAEQPIQREARSLAEDVPQRHIDGCLREWIARQRMPHPMCKKFDVARLMTDEQRRLFRETQAVMSLIEPAILVVMGVVVISILIALYMPIFNLSGAAGGGGQ